MDNKNKIKELKEKRDNLYKEIKEISREIESLKFDDLPLDKIKYNTYCSFTIPEQGTFIGIIEDLQMFTSAELRGDMSLVGKFIKMPDENSSIGEYNDLYILKQNILSFLESLSYKSALEFKCFLDLYIEKVSECLYKIFNI